MPGAGARGAYQIGVLKAVASLLVRDAANPFAIIAGTSAGAINATLFALGYKLEEQRRILKKLDFNNFMDDSWGLVRDTQRLIEKFGWYKGDFFHQWISGLINTKLRNPHATFRDLEAAGSVCLRY